jgi:hypothetical protein
MYSFCHNIFMSKRAVLKLRPHFNYKKYALAEMLERCDFSLTKDPQEKAWENALPVGNEFGSLDADWVSEAEMLQSS